MTLPAFAAERRATAPLLLSTAGHQCSYRSMGQTDWQTDRRTDAGPLHSMRAVSVMFVRCRRCGSQSRSGGKPGGSSSNKNMSAAAARASACDDFDRCPPPPDRCAQRDHCRDQPAKTERKEKKHRKKLADFHVTVCAVKLCCENRENCGK